MSDDPFEVDENKLRESMAAWRGDVQHEDQVARNEELAYERTKLSETTKFVEYILGAAATQTPVAVSTTYGSSQRGTIVAANAEMVEISANFAEVWLPTWAISTIQPIEGVRTIPLVDESVIGKATTMGSVLQELGQQGSRLQIKLEQGAVPLTGRVIAVGEDTATIRPDDSAPADIQVRIETVVEVLRFKQV